MDAAPSAAIAVAGIDYIIPIDYNYRYIRMSGVKITFPIIAEIMIEGALGTREKASTVSYIPIDFVLYMWRWHLTSLSLCFRSTPAHEARTTLQQILNSGDNTKREKERESHEGGITLSRYVTISTSQLQPQAALLRSKNSFRRESDTQFEDSVQYKRSVASAIFAYTRKRHFGAND
ncbi:hypothetical protein EVAR_99301_1 [Eumeta japonica]|uniref:Uncharacterized protein n=1 Tax=Eumeta variegata TaxID=151549 RepID=A0A4C1YYV8_EUMVA|nr:hypothetical protein EVAR_99301_1 [Eumeta japonica]